MERNKLLEKLSYASDIRYWVPEESEIIDYFDAIQFEAFEKQVEIEKRMLLNEMLDGQEKEIAKDNIEVIAYKGMEMYGYYRMICTNCWCWQYKGQ